MIVTALIAASLITGGGLQLALARYAGQCAGRRRGLVLPGVLGALALALPAAGAVAVAGVAWALPGQGVTVQGLTALAFVALIAVWALSAVLSALRA